MYSESVLSLPAVFARISSDTCSLSTRSLTGEVNLIELKRTLRDKFAATADQIESVESQLRDHTIVPKPAVRPAIRVRDKDDEWVLASRNHRLG